MSAKEEAFMIILTAAVIIYVAIPAAFLAHDTNAMIRYRFGNDIEKRMVRHETPNQPRS